MNPVRHDGRLGLGLAAGCRSVWRRTSKTARRVSMWATLVAAVVAVELGAQAPGETIRVSVSTSGVQGNSHSEAFGISKKGQLIFFHSVASNLIDGETVRHDFFVHDRQTGVTEGISIGVDLPISAVSVSENGRFVGFFACTSAGFGPFLYDRATGGTEKVPSDRLGIEPDNCSLLLHVSDNGRFLAFDSLATNLVEDDTNGLVDLFLLDRKRRAIQRVSVGFDGAESDGGSVPLGISRNGRFICFISEATNLVADDRNNRHDIFVYDRRRDRIERISVATDGRGGDGEAIEATISSSGRYVLFVSNSTDLTDEGPGGVGVPGDRYQLYVRDRKLGTTERIGGDLYTDKLNNLSPRISASGSFVTFHSPLDHLVVDDQNGLYDVFLLDRRKGVVRLISRPGGNILGGSETGLSYGPLLSRDGKYVAFTSGHPNLVTGDTNGVQDVFMHQRER